VDVGQGQGVNKIALVLDPAAVLHQVVINPMTVEQCVSEGLTALRENRSRIIPGRLNRIMNAVVPASVKRTMTAKMFGKALASKPATANIRAEA
jgi:hypothetical protein